MATATSTTWRNDDGNTRKIPADNLELYPDPDLRRGAYVALQAGPHQGLYGWVMRQTCDRGRWYVAVNDHCNLRGRYQWFPVTDLWLASNEDDDPEVAPAHRARLRVLARRRHRA